MSLKSAIKSGTKHALRAQKSIRELISITLRGEDEEYDPETDTYTTAGETVLTDVPAYFTSYDDEEVDGTAIQRKDQRCTIELRHLGTSRPENNDKMTRTGKYAGTWETMSTKYPIGDRS